MSVTFFIDDYLPMQSYVHKGLKEFLLFFTDYGIPTI